MFHAATFALLGSTLLGAPPGASGGGLGSLDGARSILVAPHAGERLRAPGPGGTAGPLELVLEGEDGEQGHAELGALRFAVNLVQPEDVPQPATPVETPGEPQGVPKVKKAPVYGAADTQWVTFGGGIADDFDENVDANLTVAYSYFVVDWAEFSVELAGWYHAQEDEEDALGVNPVLLFRWHLIHSEKWTFYIDAGIGVLFNTDSVPAGGTHVNFTPRAGVGVTRQIGEGGARLQAGFRWHHISNARITGDEGNPATDAPMIYFGIIVPF